MDIDHKSTMFGLLFHPTVRPAAAYRVYRQSLFEVAVAEVLMYTVCSAH
jgi:hypothetical protein